MSKKNRPPTSRQQVRFNMCHVSHNSMENLINCGEQLQSPTSLGMVGTFHRDAQGMKMSLATWMVHGIWKFEEQSSCAVRGVNIQKRNARMRRRAALS
jgi:hypothetical protein